MGIQVPYATRVNTTLNDLHRQLTAVTGSVLVKVCEELVCERASDAAHIYDITRLLKVQKAWPLQDTLLVVAFKRHLERLEMFKNNRHDRLYHAITIFPIGDELGVVVHAAKEEGAAFVRDALVALGHKEYSYFDDGERNPDISLAEWAERREWWFSELGDHAIPLYTGYGRIMADRRNEEAELPISEIFERIPDSKIRAMNLSLYEAMMTNVPEEHRHVWAQKRCEHWIGQLTPLQKEDLTTPRAYGVDKPTLN